MSSIDLQIKELQYRPWKDLQESMLALDFKGKSINNAVVNALRLVPDQHVPTYAFCDESIEISFNDSVFNSDEMRSRLSQIAIPKLEVPATFLPEKYWKVDYSDPDREVYEQDTRKIQMILNAHNDTTKNIDVTTNDVRYIEDGEEIPNKFNQKFPHLLIQLRPNESFRVLANAVLGVGERNQIWSPIANTWFKMKSETHYEFFTKSTGQISEYEALIKGCRVIQKKLEDIKARVEGQYQKDASTEKKITIVLDNEDHAMGNIISRTIQDLKETVFAAYSKPDHLVKSVVIKIFGKSNTMNLFMGAITHLQKLYREMEKQLLTLGKKHHKKLA